MLLVGSIVALAACSAERPELVEPVLDAATSTTVALPERSACETASGPGPATIVLTPETIPCLAIAAHHRIELVNRGAEAVDVSVGQAMLTVAPGGSQTTEAAGAVLVTGANRIVVGPATVAVAWLIDPADDAMAGQAIGLTSIGDIELGLEPAAVTAATGGIPVAAAGTPCHVATLDGDPYSPLFTFRDGRLVVVQVFTPGLVTRSGIGIGASSADIARAYGDRIEARPAQAGDSTRQFLVFVPSDEENQVYRLVFDLTDDRVTTIRFGATEIVADQPGCGP